MKLYILIFFFIIIQMDTFSQMKTEIHDTSFYSFLNTVEKTDKSKRQLIADGFIESIKDNYPIFENDKTAVLLFKGDVPNVSLIGDMTNWASSIPMKRIEGTDLFYFRGVYEHEARLEYLFELSKDEFPLVDSLNPYKSLNGFGELSELAMPGYKRHPVFKDYENGRKGSLAGLQELQISSGTLGYDHTVHVYLPPDYDSSREYPSIYFQDGKDYIEFAIVPHVLNELIQQGQIQPLIAVFVTPPNLHQPAMPNRMTEYGMNDDYVSFFVKELVPFIDSGFSNSIEASDRMVAGDSYGGLISAYIAFSHPEVFGKAYSQSGYMSFQKDRFIRLIDSLPVKWVDFYIDVGTYEESVGAAFLPEDEINFIEGNRRLKDVLHKKGYKFIYKEYHEGHTWGNWRRHLIDALIYFFRPMNIGEKD
jgi:enterochelin esterase-like enzyme